MSESDHNLVQVNSSLKTDLSIDQQIQSIEAECLLLESSIKKSDALNQLLRTVNENLSIDNIAHEMIRFLKSQFGIEYYVIFRRQDNGDFRFFHTNAEIGISQESVSTLQNFSMAGSNDNLHAAVCNRKRYIYFKDIKRSAKAESEIDIMQTFPIRTLLIFPLIANNQIIGTLDLSHPTEKIDLTKSDIDSISVLVDHLSVVLRNGLLIDTMDQQGLELLAASQRLEVESNQIRMLNQLLRNMNEAIDLSNVLEMMSAYVLENFKIQYYVVYLKNESSLRYYKSNVESLVSDELLSEFQNRQLLIEDDTGFHTTALSQKRYVYLRRIRGKSNSNAENRNLEILPMKSILIFPLIFENRVIGCLDFSMMQDYMNLTKNELSQLSIFSEQFSVVLNNSLLIDQLQNQQLELQASLYKIETAKSQIQQLSDFTRRLNENINFKELAQDVFTYLKRTFELEGSWLILVNLDKQILFTSTYLAPVDTPEAGLRFMDSFEIPLVKESGSLYRTYIRKKSFYMRRVSEETGLGAVDDNIVKELKLLWLIQFPLVIQDKVIGILSCTNYQKRLNLKQDEILHIQSVVNQIAGGVNSAYLFEQAQSQKARADALLRNILPATVANELQNTGQVATKEHLHTSIVFTDFCGFTTISSKMSAEELIRELDAYFYQFDEIIRRNNLTKLKTIGDSYMFAGGLPNDSKTHAVDCCLAALEIQAIMNQAREIKESLGIPAWELRIGINTGKVVTGIIGKDRFAYDVWGDTVDIASRMESNSEPGQINISVSTYEAVSAFFECEYRGDRPIKNHGNMEMFFLKRIRPELAAGNSIHVPNQKFHELYKQLQTSALMPKDSLAFDEFISIPDEL